MRPAASVFCVAVACVSAVGMGSALQDVERSRWESREAAARAGAEAGVARNGIDRLERSVADERGRKEAALSELREARVRLSRLELALAAEQEQTEAEHRQTLAARAESAAAYDRLDHACADVAEMERQLVEVARAKNGLERQLDELRRRYGFPEQPVPHVIEGTVLGVSDKVNLVLISVGERDGVHVGMAFNVFRGDLWISRLIVDRVEDGWCACHEVEELRADRIQEHDRVTTKELD